MSEPPEPDLPPDPIEVQKEHLATLRAGEAELVRLGSKAAAIEVESLAAEVAVKTGLANGQPSFSPEKAARAVTALNRVRALEEVVPEPVLELQDRTQMEVALSALADWLAAGTRDQEEAAAGVRTEAIIRVVLLAVVLLIFWVALTVHLAFFILMPPVIVPYTLLKRSGEDVKWRRMGAKRHFDRTKLTPPATWDEDDVRKRHTELAEAVLRMRASHGSSGSRRPNGDGDASLGDALLGDVGSGDAIEGVVDAQDLAGADATAELAGLLAELRISGGLSGHDIAPDLEAWLEKLATAHRAKRDLDTLHAARGRAERAAGDAREALFRFLARRGEAPPGGSAETDALAAGLARVTQAGPTEVKRSES